MAVRIESHAEPLPGYKLLERLGGGGFGEVWKAEAPGGLHKAIKFVFGDLQETGEDGQRAEQELKALSRVKTVRHPYILSLERYDIIDGQLIIVMELADRNLWDRFKECRAQGLPGIPRVELLGYMEEAAEALDLMNIEFQLQHLDIKPQNIFLVHNHVKVADFGLVKDLEGMVASVTGGVTPVYAAPETFDGWVSRFSDQYSLSIVYQELLTGQRPFSATTVRQLILQHLQGKPNVTPLPAADRPVVSRALAKNPEERHPNCLAFVRALRGRTIVPASSPESTGQGSVTNLDDTGPADGDTHPPDTMSPDASEVEDLQLPVSEDPPGPATRWIRAQEGEAPRIANAQAPRAAPPPVHSDGVLVPAVVVALGNLGLGVLQHFRESLHNQFGGLRALPHLRVLFMDTDPAEMRRATRGRDGAALLAGEVLLARLNRPSHYLKARDGRVPVSSWLDSHILYRIPRSLETSGIRALGRLAFCDNYALIARRLRTELEQCTEPGQLLTAERNTGLGLRSNRPRVYVVTSLVGGTGSGMFVDLAYVFRHLLRQLGYGQPEIYGVFLLPGGNGKGTRALSLANTFAALTELNHFSEPKVTFSARFQDRVAPITDSDPPFNRCVLLHLPEGGEPEKVRKTVTLAGDYLIRDLMTPLGRAADLSRAGQSASVPPVSGPACQTFGLYRFSFPKRRLVQETARRVCRNLVHRWMTKDSRPLQQTVGAWVEQQWAEQQLGAEHFIERLQTACEQALGQTPESAFTALLGPSLTQAAPAPSGKKAAPPTAALANLDPSAVMTALEELDRFVGRPEEQMVTPEPATLPQLLAQAAEEAVADMGRRLTAVIVDLVERPEFRLAGAEEAIRQTIPLIEKVLEHHETLSHELTTQAREAHLRIRMLLQTFPRATAGKKSNAQSSWQTDLLELLRAYPKWRYQSLILQQLSYTYVSLRGNLSDQLREINFCRARLSELARSLEEDEYRTKASLVPEKGFDWSQAEPPGPDCALYPGGSRTFEATRDQLLQGLTPEDVLQLDEQMEEMMCEQFSGLRHVCMTSVNLLRNLERTMLAVGEQFVSKRLDGVDVAELFREFYPEEQGAGDQIKEAFDAALPVRGSTPGKCGVEVCVLASPCGAPGDRFRDLSRRTLGQTDPAMVASKEAEDLVFYRELSSLPLGSLDQVGPAAYEAYSQIASVPHFTPHNRTDITQWRAARTPTGNRADGTEDSNQITVLNGPAAYSGAR
jgi:serine/threonine protein kinase